MKTTLLKKFEVAEGTIEFQFSKPEEFVYKAGQSIDLTLIDPKETDDKGTMRAYSLASAPYEPYLAVVTRVRDTAFKRVLQKLPEGAEVHIDGPFGDLTLQENTKRTAVFLAGGIGVTLFRSIILQAAKEKLPHKLVLFYSNRRPEDTPFLPDLFQAAKEHSSFTFVPTMTAMDKSAKVWEGERGYIDTPMLDRYLKDAIEPIYYLAGPIPMVRAMRKLLSERGVSGDDIRTEEFTGYI